MPRFYHGGVELNLPPQLRELPFELLRNHQYPRNPAAVASAVQTYGRPLPAVMFPQRMAFQRWKTSQPFQPAWGQNAQGVVNAVESGQAQVAALSRRGVPPVMLPAQGFAAEQELNELPEPSATLDPNLDAVPVARGYLPPNRLYLSSEQLNEYVAREQAQRLDSRTAANVRQARAMSEVAAQQDALAARVTPDPRNVPWYLR